MTPTLIKGLLALVPTYMLLVASAIMCSKEKRVWSQAGRYSRYAIEGSLNLLNLRVAFLQSRDGDVPLPPVLPSVVARQSASGACNIGRERRVVLVVRRITSLRSGLLASRAPTDRTRGSDLLWGFFAV